MAGVDDDDDSLQLLTWLSNQTHSMFNIIFSGMESRSRSSKHNSTYASADPSLMDSLHAAAMGIKDNQVPCKAET